MFPYRAAINSQTVFSGQFKVFKVGEKNTHVLGRYRANDFDV